MKTLKGKVLSLQSFRPVAKMFGPEAVAKLEEMIHQKNPFKEEELEVGESAILAKLILGR